jgi:hypothetical protein
MFTCTSIAECNPPNAALTDCWQITPPRVTDPTKQQQQQQQGVLVA